MYLKNLKYYTNNIYSYLPIILIILVGLSFRLYGINWDEGFAYTPHPDERAIISKVNQIELPPISIDGAKEFFNPLLSSWNPRWFPYGSFPIYLLKIVQILYNYVFDSTLFDLRLSGRIISAISDTLTIGVIFLIGKKLYGYKTGLLASALLACSVLHIQLSHFYTVDTILTLFSTLSVYFIIRNIEDISKIYSIFTGLFIALAIATKISLLPILGIFIFGHLFYIFGILQKFTLNDIRLYSKNRIWISFNSIKITTIIFIITLLIIQPYMFLDWQNFYKDISEQSQMVRRFLDYPYTRQYINTPSFWYQIKQVSIWGLGIPLGLISFLGLIYAYFEGLKRQTWIIYTIFGWIIPVTMLIYSTNTIILFLASAIGIISLLFTIPYRSHNSVKNVLILAWIIPIFLITGSFEVKFLRYFLPITPFIILLGSKLMIDIINLNSKYFSKLKFISYSFNLFIILTTFIYAISFVNIYSQPHTAVKSSKWIEDNIPKNSMILKEHWEESLPRLDNYRTLELPMYDNDSINKLTLISKRLAEADYLVLYSNRLYGTINKLPERYPLSTAYYQLLFREEIGYKFVNLETNYPNILNINFKYNTFENLQLNIPDIFNNIDQEKKYNINLGNSDESFSVYDHPSVFILKNTKTLSENQIKDLIISRSQENELKNIKALKLNKEKLLIEEKEFSKRIKNGSWNEAINIFSWSNSYPILAWLLILELIFIITLPISFLIFKNLPDKGYTISKTLSLLTLSITVWWISSLKLMMFTRFSVFISIGFLSIIAVYISMKNYKKFFRFIKSQWKILLTSEIIFLIAFLGFVAVRMANPDLWHPWRGGEKPMDLAYLNAILHSSYMPPIDPWYSGGFMNYYYYGHFITSILIMGTGIIPTTAYNLAIPLFFALVFSSSFSIIYNLCEMTINKKDYKNKSFLNKFFKSPILFGFICAFFVTLLGNLDGGIQLINILSNQVPNGFDYWASSRIMPSDTYGITEFPYFTFLFADLHAHLMSLPFTILVLFISINIISEKNEYPNKNTLSKYTPRLLNLTLLGVAIGALRVLNAWDYPTYLIIGCISILIVEYYHHGGLSLITISKSIFQSIYIFIIGYLTFIPFHLTYQTFFNSIDKTPHTTEFWRILIIFGLFIFITSSFYLQNSTSILKNIYSLLKNKIFLIYSDLTKSSNHKDNSSYFKQNIQLIILLLSITLLGFIITYIMTKGISSTILFTSIILFLGFITLSKYNNYNPQTNFTLIINIIGLSLIIGLDIFRIEGDIDRMNSIFKFYMQIWIIFAISSTYFLWIIIKDTINFNIKFMLWIAILIFLILTSSIYTIFGTKARLNDRFQNDSANFTLNGSDFVNYAVYNDPNGSNINLKLDFEGIEWIQNSIKGTPVILEAHTPSYRWGSRVSVYTGLPTVIGWKWHQEQQRWNYREEILKRIQDVETIYNSTNIQETISLIDKYKINYIYVGEIEKSYYSEEGLKKFDKMPSLNLEFRNSEVKIFKTHLNTN